MIQPQDKYVLRLPDGMRSLLKESADKNNRSMNAEIIGRLEAYDSIYARMAELVEERERLTAQLEATRDALNEQKAVSAGLQNLIHERLNEAEQDHETESIITKKFNELKSQTDYLESLKTELLEISKERDEIKSESEVRLQEQAALIERLTKSQETNAIILKGFRKVFLRAADGEDDDLKKLVEIFQTIGEEDI